MRAWQQGWCSLCPVWDPAGLGALWAQHVEPQPVPSLNLAWLAEGPGETPHYFLVLRMGLMPRKEVRGVNALYLSLPKGLPWKEPPRARYSADMDTSDEELKGAQLPAHHGKRRNRASSQENISHSSNQVSNSLCPHQSL